MAIKVNGTTVINDSRALSNIASLDATTVAAIGAAGIGGGDEWQTIATYTNTTTYDQGTSFQLGPIGVTMPNYTSLTGFAFVIQREIRMTSGQYGPDQKLLIGPQTNTGSLRWNAGYNRYYNLSQSSGQPIDSTWYNAVFTIDFPITYGPQAYDAGSQLSSNYVRPAIAWSLATTKSNRAWEGDWEVTDSANHGGLQVPLDDSYIQPNASWNYFLSKDSTGGVRNQTFRVVARWS